jgi:anti-sigma factor RsiW
MQGMECRNFRELLDSYLCGELAVETNHAILRHAEHCAPCRGEMAGRRELRQKLRRACTQDRMSLAATERLRTCLRSEAQAGQASAWNLRPLTERLFRFRFLIPAAAAALLVVILGSIWWLAGSKSRKYDQENSLMEAAAEDHLRCGSKYAAAAAIPVSNGLLKSQDPAYAGLEEAAENAASQLGGLQLRAAHVCSAKGRRFAHLVYARGQQIVSLQVTERDQAALGTAELPKDDGTASGLQQALQAELTLGAYQTHRHVVLVVVPMQTTEGKILADNLGRPVAEYLRSVEGGQIQVSANPRSGQNLVLARYAGRNRKHK